MANNCAKISFKYMDGILRRWYTQGIRTPEDLQKESERPAASAGKAKPSGQASSYDMQELTQRADRLPVYKKRKGSGT